MNKKIEVPGGINVQKSIYTEAKRTFLQEKAVANGLAELLDEKKNEYMNEVRMRKHDMKPHMRNVRSLAESILDYLGKKDSLDEVDEKIESKVYRLKYEINKLTELLDCLSDEEKFAKPEDLNLDQFFSDLEKSFTFTLNLAVSNLGSNMVIVPLRLASRCIFCITPGRTVDI